MARKNKIVLYDLEEEVDDLLHAGYGVYKIRDIIRDRHKNNSQLKSISHMSIQRYKEEKDRNKITECVEAGDDPVDMLQSEFRSAIREQMDRSEEIYKEAKCILEEAKQSDRVTDKIKAVEMLLKNIDRQEKSWLTLIHYGNRQVNNINNLNLKKEQNVKIMLIDTFRDLCPDCAKKALSKIQNFSDD